MYFSLQTMKNKQKILTPFLNLGLSNVRNEVTAPSQRTEIDPGV